MHHLGRNSSFFYSSISLHLNWNFLTVVNDPYRMIFATRSLFIWSGSPGGSDMCSPLVPLAFGEMLRCCQWQRGQLQGSLAQEKCKEEKKGKKNVSRKTRRGGKFWVAFLWCWPCVAGKHESAGMPGTRSQGRVLVALAETLHSTWHYCNLSVPLLLWQRSENETAGDSGESTIRHSDNFLWWHSNWPLHTMGQDFTRCHCNLTLIYDLF